MKTRVLSLFLVLGILFAMPVFSEEVSPVEELVSFEEDRILILGGDVFHMTEPELRKFFDGKGYRFVSENPSISAFECANADLDPEIIRYFLSKGKVNRVLFVDEHPADLYDLYVQLFTETMGEPVHSDAYKKPYGDFPEQNKWEIGPYSVTMYGGDTASLQECMEDKATLCIQFFRYINEDTLK